MRSFRAFVAAIAAIALLAVPARASTRRVLVLNQGNAAIMYLRVGSAANAKWSADLLGYDDAIAVGRGMDVAIDVDDTTCTYDLQATYDDGTTQVAPSVDLCSTDRVSFYEPLPGR
ncbi:MAG TPA: hypothetical protein VK760_14845 [Candidatus Acidoferrales bacterium]|jgi:hypothetical protein|nr:hypothetical protein [Candidatus Acidoferrales bacterium]